MRLSFISAFCVPVKSMPLIVAVKVIAVCASFSTNDALPNEVRGAPVTVVGMVAGIQPRWSSSRLAWSPHDCWL